MNKEKIRLIKNWAILGVIVLGVWGLRTILNPHVFEFTERLATQEEIDTLPHCSGVGAEPSEPYEVTVIAPNGKEYKMLVANATTTYSFPCIK